MSRRVVVPTGAPAAAFPVVTMMTNSTNPTPEKGAKLLAKLALGWSITAACKAEKIHRDTYYHWRANNPIFAAKADAAIEQGTDILEDEAKRRAVGGSDTLLIFLLKSRRPDKYRDRLDVNHSGTMAARVELIGVDPGDV